MPSLDRYLKDVGSHLPGGQADDIINELGENIRAQIDDRQDELGRELTTAEVDEILKAHGNPLVVASRYRKEQLSFSFGRQLIGPALFPAYLRVLTINIAITAIVVLMAAVLLVSGQPLGGTMSSLALAVLIQFGVVTGIFIAADRMVTGESSFGFSDAAVADLPRGDRSMLDRIAENLIGKEVGATVPRRTSATDLAVSALFVGWLVAIRPPQEIGFVRSGPGWETWYLPLILVVAAAGIQPVITLVRPAWTRLRSIVRIGSDLAIFGLFVASIRIGEWVVLADPGTAGPGVRTAIVEINRWIGVSLTIAAAIALAQFILEARRLLMNERAGSSVATAAV